MPAKTMDLPRAWTLVLVIAAAVLMAPFAGWVILAIWLSGFARGLHERLARRMRNRQGVAAFVTVLILTLVLVPIGAIITTLVLDSISLIGELAHSDRVHSVLVALVSDKHPNPKASVSELLLMQSERAWGILKVVVTSAAEIIIGLVVLLAGIYAMLVEGRRWYAWAEEHAPVSPAAFRRLAEAFVETGRGLMFGIAGAGLLQAFVATLAFLFLGIPQAFALGLLTLVFSIVPLVGTALVWGPVAAGLALTGRLYGGIGLAIYGVLVIGTIDNLARPWLTRFGNLQLPGFIVLVSMFGAVDLFGGWGIVFGPLIVRLAKEALEVRRETVEAQSVIRVEHES